MRPMKASLSLPSGRFGQTVQRKAELFDTLVSLLKEPGQPVGLSRHDFDSWLLRALAAIAVADGIFRDATVVRPREISAIHSSDDREDHDG